MKPFNEEEKQYTGELKAGEYMLHGDVIVTKLEKLPEDFDKLTKITDNCLAYGEATGHLHKLFGDTVDIREDNTGARYFKVDNVLTLKHQEHEKIKVPPGVYKSTTQIEYDHFEGIIREVID